MNYDAPSRKVSRSVRALLASRGESITSLSAETFIAESTLKRRLLGHSSFTLEEAGYIAHHFDVTIHDLLNPPFEEGQDSTVAADRVAAAS
ncbi:helix-turn-helix transcriptional regulator [Curtobacterium sp. MCBD17_003]|uniref:helix-turn-helix transcriptional regulator n=1 Tax=Curtobacterium sp. MCBD17_003 TaxID=2175667 RepID=UPI000DB8B94E|nr:helix-turn-helix transcriptional regulator [Curtobacterium sp. MCBD17_003]WIE54201.1 helix-turn-helix transcriptional regulator [Curtobacterium sp. MCBD17_003]